MLQIDKIVSIWGVNNFVMNKESRKALIHKAVESGITKYIASRRNMVDAFVEDNFSLKKALNLNKAALGYDLIKAPVNVVWSPFYFILTFSGKGIAKFNKGKTILRNYLQVLVQP
jgi:hypothetical protein